jgi:hypothetical protein
VVDHKAAEQCNRRTGNMKTDLRVLVWFFSWLLAAGCLIGSVLILAFSSKEDWIGKNPLPFLSILALAAVCFAVALAPWYWGIRCRECRRRLRKADTPRDCSTGMHPLEFYCADCRITWKTYLVSGPGDPHRTSH